MRISDWSSDVCSSDLLLPKIGELPFVHERLFSRWPVIRWKLYVVESPLFIFRSYIRCSVNIGHSKLPPQVHCPLIPCDIRSERRILSAGLYPSAHDFTSRALLRMRPPPGGAGSARPCNGCPACCPFLVRDWVL